MASRMWWLLQYLGHNEVHAGSWSDWISYPDNEIGK